MININPFKALTHFSARSYKTTFKGKFKDTFDVFCGTFNNKERGIDAGIFDYLTLGSFLFLILALNAIFEKLQKHPDIQIIVTAIIDLTFLPRLFFAIIMTLSCIPFIGIAHLLTREKGNEIKENICKSEVHIGENKFYSIAALLKTQNIELENIEHSKITQGPNEGKIELSFLHDKAKPITTFSLALNNKADLTLFQHFEQLNIGNIKETLSGYPELRQAYEVTSQV